MQFFPSMKNIAASPDEEGKKAAVEQVMTGLSLLEKAHGEISKGKPFFGGDHIGYLDIAFGALLGWLRVTQNFSGLKLIHPESTPNLAHWAEKFSQDPAVSGVLPDTEKLSEFAKLIFSKFKAAQ